jgi:hypothetical protein
MQLNLQSFQDSKLAMELGQMSKLKSEKHTVMLNNWEIKYENMKRLIFLLLFIINIP